MKKGVPIFEYHDIGYPGGEKNPFHAPYVLSETPFEEQLKWLYENRYLAITLEEILFEGANSKTVVLTFDDGHISNHESVFPILKQFGYAATFFIVPGFVGKTGYMTWEHIREMKSAGMDFQGHSLTHPYILLMREEEIRRELIESKSIIEEKIGSEVTCFSVPYGFYNGKLSKIVKEVGYRCIVTEDFGFYVPEKAPFKLIPRITVKSTIETAKFRLLAEGKRSKLLKEYGIAVCLTGVKRLLGCKMYLQLKSAFLGYSYEKPQTVGDKE